MKQLHGFRPGLVLSSLFAATLAFSGHSAAQATEPAAAPAEAAPAVVAPAPAPVTTAVPSPAAAPAPVAPAPVTPAPVAPAPRVATSPVAPVAPEKKTVTAPQAAPVQAPAPQALGLEPQHAPAEAAVGVAPAETAPVEAAPALAAQPVATGEVLGAAQPAAAEHGEAAHGHEQPGHDHADVAHDAHGHGEGAHGEGAHGAHHEPHFSDINWFTGLVGEKEGVEPSLLWRAPGTPVPLGALLINSAILFFLLFKFGGPAIQRGLIERKKRVVSGIEAAAAMKDEASGQLFHYEEKLRKIDEEIENIKTQMREQAEAERKRILNEAKSRREQLEADARLLVSQELKLAREELFKEVVAEAVNAAEETIKKQVGAADQQRLADDFLAGLDGALRGGAARGMEKLS